MLLDGSNKLPIPLFRFLIGNNDVGYELLCDSHSGSIITSITHPHQNLLLTGGQHGKKVVKLEVAPFNANIETNYITSVQSKIN